MNSNEYLLVVSPPNADLSVTKMCQIEGGAPESGETVVIPIDRGRTLTARFVSLTEGRGGKIYHVSTEYAETCAVLYLAFGFMCSDRHGFGREHLAHNWGQLRNTHTWAEISPPTEPARPMLEPGEPVDLDSIHGPEMTD